MFRPFLAVLAVLVTVAGCASTTASVSQMSPAEVDSVRLRVLDAVNAVRIEQGLSPLRYSAELNAAAETHARDMSVQDRAWHFGSDKTSPRERAFRAGYLGEISGENIAEGTDTDLVVLKSWLDFADTRKIMLDPAARGMGLGWYKDATGKTWWVQLVGQ
jgi:uncharacterized protein YkwD